MASTKKSRGHRESSDLSPEDRHAHKYSKRSSTGCDKHLVGEMVSHLRLSPDGRHAHRHGKRARHSHDKHTTDNMACDSVQGASRSSQKHRHSEGIGSDSSDEILIKHRASRQVHRENDKDDHISRQLKSNEKAQREAFRPSSSSSQEIHIHYVPVVTNSAEIPLTISRQSHSRSSAASSLDGYTITKSKSAGISASEITNQLKGLTMSWIKKRDRSRSRSRRSKHEKRDKHGKRKEMSKFLAPLRQRWVCYGCGKLRSDSIQARRPLREGQKMQPNFCGKCRVQGELKGRQLDWEGQRHYCWGCGIVRSQEYHREHPIAEGERCTPNYCRRCRELSPSFDYHLREASELGSEISVRDQAFHRQMRDAELSDIDEDEDEETASAPGKENQDPTKGQKLRASRSYMLKNCSFQTKSNSDASSEGSLPVNFVKAVHVDEDMGCESRGGGVRLSAGSCKRLSAESAPGGSSILDIEPFGGSEDRLETGDGITDCEMGNTGAAEPGRDGLSASPIIPIAIQPANTASSTLKKVHWIKDANRPITAESSCQPYQSDSGFSSDYRSDVSMKSTGSRGRHRRDPTAFSTGSPPEQEGVRTVESVGDSLQGSADKSNVNIPPVAAVRQTLSGYPYTMPPTPPPTYEPLSAESASFDHHGGQNASKHWNSSTQSPFQDIPNFSRPYHSPSKPRDSDDHVYGNPVSSPGYGTRPDYLSQPYAFNSTAHFSDSTTRRDFSGYEAPDFDVYNSPEHGKKDASFYVGYGSGCPFPPSPPPPPPGDSSFDFSHIGETHAEGPAFKRERKFAQTATPQRHSWRLYDEGDVDDYERGDYEWRDGQTTVHRVDRSQVPNSGNRITILSIREIKSDEELSEKDDDDDDSELDTVINASTIKPIRAA